MILCGIQILIKPFSFPGSHSCDPHCSIIVIGHATWSRYWGPWIRSLSLCFFFSGRVFGSDDSPTSPNTSSGVLAVGTEQQYATTYSNSGPSAMGLGIAMVTALQVLLRAYNWRYVLAAGCSLLISPGRCFKTKWHCHFGIPRQRTRLYYVPILMMGCLLGICGSGYSSNINTPLQSRSDIGVAATSQKVYQLTAYTSYS